MLQTALSPKLALASRLIELMSEHVDVVDWLELGPALIVICGTLGSLLGRTRKLKSLGFGRAARLRFLFLDFEVMNGHSAEPEYVDLVR